MPIKKDRRKVLNGRKGGLATKEKQPADYFSRIQKLRWRRERARKRAEEAGQKENPRAEG